MRSGIEDNEFKYECNGGAICCDFTGEVCSSGDCRYCYVYNESESEFHASEMKQLVPCQSTTVEGISFIKNFENTIIQVKSVDDAIKMFHDCEFFDIRYSPNEMHKLYPLLFKLKAHLSLGIPEKLLGNGIHAPLIVVFKNGSIYIISPVVIE